MSGGSAFRNAVKRVAHKERAQPSARAKMGLLEKHKDYVVRAKDFKNKKSYLSGLKKKAAERNPDEFYFKMNTSAVVNGKHKDLEKEKERSLDVETVKLLKTQDAGYIAQKKAIDDSKIERLKSNLHFIGEKRPHSHVVFVDSESEVKDFDAAEHFDTVPEMVDRHFNRIKRRALEKMVEDGEERAKSSSSKGSGNGGVLMDGSNVSILKQKAQGYKELKQRVERSEKLGKVLNELHLQRAIMGKGSKKKIISKDAEGREKVVYKWKRQRSK